MTDTPDIVPQSLTRPPNPRYLRVFEAVARLESFSKAAAELRLSQPALTQTLGRLEADIGQQLLDRKATGTYATAFGQNYLERARRFFRRLESALAEISPADERPDSLRRIFRITRSQIACHVMIFRSRSFGQAAAGVGVSASSLHKAARELELNLGVPLYRKLPTGIMVTEAGAVLGRAMLLAIGDMVSTAEDLGASSIAANTLNMGVQFLEPASFLAGVMGSFTNSHPDCTICMINSTFDDLQQRIRLGLLDVTVGVLREQPEDLSNEGLFEDPYFVAARQGHPLAAVERVTTAQLLEFDWIVPNPGAPRRQAFDHLFRDMGRRPQTSIETHSFSAIRATMCDSDRLTILTRSELAPDERMGLLVRLRTDPLEPRPVIGLTTRADWAPTPLQQAFVNLIRRHGAASQGAGS